MLKLVTLAAASAGCVSLAGAQNFSLSLIPSNIDVGPGSSFTLSVFGDADIGTHMLGGAFSLESNGQCIQSMQWTPAAWSAFNTDGGFAGDGDYNEVVFGQLVIPGIFPPAPGSELGGLIGSYAVQLDPSIGDFSIDFQLIAASPFSLETVDAVTGDTYQSSNGNLSLGSVSVQVLPAPGAVSAFAFCGLIGARRRRRTD